MQATETPATETAEEGTELFAGLKVMLGNLTATLDRQRATLDKLQHKLYTTPVSAPIIFSSLYNTGAPGNTQVPAAGPLLLSASGPEVGRKWNVRNLSITDGGNPNSSVAGTAQVFVGQPIPPSGTQAAAAWVPVRGPSRWLFPSLPNVATFGSNELPVLAQDNLLIVLYGGTPGQSILAGGIADDFSLADAAGPTYQAVEV